MLRNKRVVERRRSIDRLGLIKRIDDSKFREKKSDPSNDDPILDEDISIEVSWMEEGISDGD